MANVRTWISLWLRAADGRPAWCRLGQLDRTGPQRRTRRAGTLPGWLEQDHDYEDTTPPRWSRWLLVRRSLTPNSKGELELSYYLCCAPTTTTDDELIRVAGARWAVEECFQTAKTEVGLDHYQVRRYDA